MTAQRMGIVIMRILVNAIHPIMVLTAQSVFVHQELLGLMNHLLMMWRTEHLENVLIWYVTILILVLEIDVIKGICDRETGICQCRPGFTGPACNMSKSRILFSK
jgi:hypothetical protein